MGAQAIWSIFCLNEPGSLAFPSISSLQYGQSSLWLLWFLNRNTFALAPSPTSLSFLPRGLLAFSEKFPLHSGAPPLKGRVLVLMVSPEQELSVYRCTKAQVQMLARPTLPIPKGGWRSFHCLKVIGAQPLSRKQYGRQARLVRTAGVGKNWSKALSICTN